MDIHEVRSVFNARRQKHDIQFEPKPEQLSAAQAVAQGKNCLCFLPTGFGKTLCFIINNVVSNTPSITLVISPLLSLMDNQMDTLSKWNFTCTRIGSDTSSEELQGVARGDYAFVFASPESALKPKWRSIYLNDVWQQQLNCIVFDEAHCISEWGEDFRPEYKEMAQLRSFFKVPVMALTATCTAQIKEDVMAVLQLNEADTEVIVKSVNRPNIFLQCYQKKSSDYEVEIKWLIDHLKAKGNKSKKIIIYCRSIDTVSEIFISIKQALGKYAYVNQVEKSANLIVEMYHKCTHESSKRRILSEFIKSESSIRCLVATVALGMGLDVKDVDMIVHIGCPHSVISYWQEAGRCARDGRQGLSLILHDKFTASLKTTNKAMSEIVKSAEDKCIRQMVIDHFTVSGKEDLSHNVCKGCAIMPCICPSCTCCSFCSQKCPCATRGVMCAELLLNRES